MKKINEIFMPGESYDSAYIMEMFELAMTDVAHLATHEIEDEDRRFDEVMNFAKFISLVMKGLFDDRELDDLRLHNAKAFILGEEEQNTVFIDRLVDKMADDVIEYETKKTFKEFEDEDTKLRQSFSDFARELFAEEEKEKGGK